MSDKLGVIKIFYRWGLLFLVFILLPATFFGQHEKENDIINEENQEEMAEADFQAGEMILEHITDSYEWHIITIGHTHVSIFLPVILYDEGEWHLFMSSKFHHGHESYLGYFISKQDMNAGKIVKLDERGNEIRPYLDISITKNVVAIFLSMIFMIVIFVSVAKSYKKRKDHAPKGLQSLLEPLILFIRDDMAKASIGEKKYEKYMPFLLTLFFFIFLNNLFGIGSFFSGGSKPNRKHCNNRSNGGFYFCNHHFQRK